jgi:hypothetical protein
MKKKLQIIKWCLGKNTVLLLLFVFSVNLQAQLQNNGVLYVSDNNYLFVNSAGFSFGSAATTSTNKSLPYSASNGKYVLGQSASFSTDGTSSKFINGYAETRNTAETLLAIGSGSTYAPIKVTPSFSTGVHATYVNAAPLTTFNGGLLSGVNAVANSEYWMIKGVNSIISLSWRASSGISSFGFADVIIVGYKNNKWEAIPSEIDVTSKFGGQSSLSGAGSVTSTISVNLSDYSAFAIGEKGVSCGDLIASSGNIKTWNGSGWSPAGAPTLADPVVIAAPYAAGSFSCNSITLNANVTLSGSQVLEIVNGASGTGKVILSSEASLVQRNFVATAPQIELTKTTRPMKRFDYVYWGAPVSGNVLSQIDGAQAQGAATANAFDFKFQYVSGTTSASGGWQALTATTPGKGFITRVKDQAPYTTASTTAPISLKFDGIANNGDVTVAIANVAGNSTSARNNNLLSNPYPSAIDASKFLTENNDILDGAIYLWRANTSNTGSGQAYTVGDYIAYTKVGSTAYSGTGTDVFNGNIASGQGFKVKAIAPGSVKFTNCMRVATSGSNSQFYRTSEYTSNPTVTLNRYKLNVQTAEGVANQILVAYTPEASLNYDSMYDAELYSVSPINLYSILDDSDRKLAINARPSFDEDDVVFLGLTQENAQITQMSIALGDKEGIFENNQTPVYLHDTQLNTYHDFADGAYTFTTAAQEENNRFKIVYEAPLKNNLFDINNAIAILNDNNLKVEATSDIQMVEVFDLTGRLILTTKPSELATSIVVPFYQASGVYIVKMELTNGQTISQKLIQK